MRFDIITIFPEFFGGPLDYGIVRRAREARLVETCIHDLRDYTHDRHRTVDDRPFGGGEGMVMKPEPLFDAVESILNEKSPPLPRDPIRGAEDAPSARMEHPENLSRTAIVLLSASGKIFKQETARRLAKLDRIVLICGRYEGVDERVAEHLATDEISIGDFVLSGGELPAAMIVEAVTRLIPGALGNEDSTVNESFSEPDAASEGAQQATPLRNPPHVAGRGITDYPHYTRPQSFRGWDVPETLMSGNHEEIHRWRREKALEKTRRNRPDLIDGA
jgi:tRNA (guanine37-N1)-methyltransferase